MSWNRLCDTAHGHPKFADAGLEAAGLWTLTLSHCGAYLTDGHVKRAAALRVAGSAEVLDRLAATLVRVGLWELHVSGDGWQVHDYLDFNPSKAKVMAERAAKSKAGKNTAAKRWGSTSDSSSNSSTEGPATPAATPPADAPVPSRPDPRSHPEERSRLRRRSPSRASPRPPRRLRRGSRRPRTRSRRSRATRT